MAPSTALLPPPPTWGAAPRGERILDDGPAFILSPSRRARYCHRPRSGWVRDGGRRRTFQTWCGQLVYQPIELHAPDVVTPLCGACEGKAVGAGWPTAEQVATGTGADPRFPQRFTPRSHWDPPRVCPGSELELHLPHPDNWRRGTCMVCLADVKLRARGTWHHPTFGAVTHTPEHMIPPCRVHGWLHLTWLDPDRYLVGCRCRLHPDY